MALSKAFSKLKAYLRKIADRIVVGQMRALEARADVFKSGECTNYLPPAAMIQLDRSLLLNEEMWRRKGQWVSTHKRAQPD